MTQLNTTLPCRLKLAPSSQCYPWLKSGSKRSHFTRATVKWDWCSRGQKGPHCVWLLLRCTLVKCLSHAFFPIQVCHLAAAHLWAPPQHTISGQECCSLSIYKTVQTKSIQRLVQKHLMFVALRPLCPFKLEISFCLFSSQMEMVMQAKENVINNTNWGTLGENFSFEKWLLCMNMSCHQKFIWIVLTFHICIYFSSATAGPFSLFN